MDVSLRIKKIMDFQICIQSETIWDIIGDLNETQNNSDNMSNIILTKIKMSTKEKYSLQTQYSPGEKNQHSDNASKSVVE